MHKDQLKVFFACAAIPDDTRRQVYATVRQLILDLGYGLTYDWMSDIGKISPAELFIKTDLAIKEADVVVAEVTFPSTGVGQQISLATSRKIPVIALKADWEQPGRFTPGAQGDLMRYFEYNQVNLKKILRDTLGKIKTERFIKFNLVSTSQINQILETESEKVGQSRSQLLRQIIRNWLAEYKD